MEELAPLHVSAPFSPSSSASRSGRPTRSWCWRTRTPATGWKARRTGSSYANQFSLQSGQRYVAFSAINGAGKSTLIKTIAGELKPLTGNAIFNKGLAVGYFAQHQIEMLRHDESPLWHLARIAQSAREQDLRSYLGGFNFPGDMATSSIETFSGARRARLALALIVLAAAQPAAPGRAHQPSRPGNSEALTVALAQFEGTLVLVSHDRHLLRATTDQFLSSPKAGCKAFDGDLEDYRDWLFRTKLAPTKNPCLCRKRRKPAVTAGRPTGASKNAGCGSAPSASPRRAEKPIESRIKRLEEKMAKLNAQKSAIDAQLADPAAYGEAQKEALKTLILDRPTSRGSWAQLEAEWLEQQQRLEEVTV